MPNDYRQFLLNNNGGVVNDQTFFVEGLGQEVLMDVFYGIAIFHGRTLNIDYWLQEYKGEIGGNELVIGRDPGGHQLLYITEGEDKGIYYWDANYFFAQSSEQGNTYFVADSFMAFCESLRDFKLPQEVPSDRIRPSRLLLMNSTPWGKNSEQAMQAFEQQIGFALPADYRLFLLESNGAELLNQSFFAQGLDQQIKLQVLFGLHNTASRGLMLAYWLAEYKEELGPDTLLIGKDRGGNFLLYTVAGEEQGIYYWDARGFFPQSADGGGNTYFVADDFTAFCQALRDYSPPVA